MRKLYYSQFILKEKPGREFADWQYHTIDGMTLSHCSSLNFVKLQVHDLQSAYILGDAISELSSRNIRVNLDDSIANQVSHIHKTIFGRYVIFFLKGGKLTIVGDPAGTLGIVFDRHRKSIASTPSLLLNCEPEHRLFNSSLDSFPNGGPEWFYPAGATPVPGIVRLLPNHRLQLPEWTCLRLDELAFPPQAKLADPASGAKDILAKMSGMIKDVVDMNVPVYAGLTAGADTRMILAASREFANRIKFVTFRYADRSGRGLTIDQSATAVLSEKFNLDHTFVDVPGDKDLDLEDLNFYQNQYGYITGSYKARDWFLTCERHCKLSGIWINGFGGELLRGGMYWNERDKILRPNAIELCKRAGLPLRLDLIDTIDKWLSDIHFIDSSRLADIGYLENRIGSLIGPRLYGSAQFRAVYCPFLSGTFLNACKTIPLSQRIEQDFVGEFIRHGWPELLDVPINDHPHFSQRFAERIRWKWQILRRLLTSS